MPHPSTHPASRLLIPLFILLIAMACVAAAQRPAPVVRVAGVDASSGISYALLSIDGKLAGGLAAPTPPPRLTAQCTADSSGKLKFEVLADFGNVAAISFFPPFKASADRPFAPPPQNASVSMEFLGYVKQKPVKRQWTWLTELPDEMRYANPGIRSSNMEPIAYYLQYLRALPTLRLTVTGRPVAEFETSAWQVAVKAEPLCRASGL